MTATRPASRANLVDRRQIFWVRWAVRGVLLLGVAASLAANMLHAQPNPYARVIAAWPPVALFVTIEVISRVPVDRAILARVRVAATVAIGGIAAWVSYLHMVAVVARYGEHGATPYLLPLSVDGLVVIASISLFELAARLRITPPNAATPGPADPPSPGHDPPAVPVAVAPQAAAPGSPGRQLSAGQVAAQVAALRQTRPPVPVEEIARHVGRSVRQVQRIIERAGHPPPASEINGRHLPALTGGDDPP